jgi:hypothetical protein
MTNKDNGLLTMQGIDKYFPGVQALSKNVSEKGRETVTGINFLNDEQKSISQ